MTKQIRAAIPEAWALMDREATLDNTRSAVWAILAHLEGMEAVTNSQPVAQETTTDAPAQCLHPFSWVAVHKAKGDPEIGTGIAIALTCDCGKTLATIQDASVTWGMD